MTRSLLSEFHLQNFNKFEYLGTGATNSNDSSPMTVRTLMINFFLDSAYLRSTLYARIPSASVNTKRAIQ